MISNLPPVETPHQTANRFVYKTLLRAIANGDISPGQRLREQELVAWLNVSRTPIREALMRLESEGWVDNVPYKGAVVNQFDAQDIQEEYTLRAALEGFAVELAIRNLTEQGIAELETLASKMETLIDQQDIQAYLQVNHDFHLRLYQFSGSRRLVEMIDISWQKMNRYRRLCYAQSEGIHNEKSFHTSLLEACRERDAQKARSLVTQSCLDTAAFIIDIISRKNGDPSDSGNDN